MLTPNSAARLGKLGAHDADAAAAIFGPLNPDSITDSRAQYMRRSFSQPRYVTSDSDLLDKSPAKIDKRPNPPHCASVRNIRSYIAVRLNDARRAKTGILECARIQSPRKGARSAPSLCAILTAAYAIVGFSIKSKNASEVELNRSRGFLVFRDMSVIPNVSRAEVASFMGNHLPVRFVLAPRNLRDYISGIMQIRRGVKAETYCKGAHHRSPIIGAHRIVAQLRFVGGFSYISRMADGRQLISRRTSPVRR